jgi:hypothetical protein
MYENKIVRVVRKSEGTILLDVSLDWGMILKWILNEQTVELFTEFNLLRT